MAPAVLIVGAGPVGSTCALLLARHGIPVTLVERRVEPARHPQGHVINARTMEIWREIDPDLERRALAASAPIDEIRHVTWCTRLAGRQLGQCLAVPETSEEIAALAALGPSRSVHLPQHRLEPLLWARCAAADRIQFRSGCELVDIANADGRVDATLRDVRTGQTERIAGQYAIAADGARGTIRTQLGIGATGGSTLQHMISIHFEANLRRFTRGREGVLFWIYNRDVVGPLVHHMGDDWVFMVPYQPPQQQPADFTAPRCRELLYAAIGSRAVDLAIRSIGGWTMTTQVAERYRDRHVLLAGDAAHQFPPTGGFGTNAGIGDVHNLAWKLRAVLGGVATEALLDTYEAERRPVALENAAQSELNFHRMDEVHEILGIPAARRAAVAGLAGSGVFGRLPHGLQRAVVAGVSRLGMQRLAVLERDGAAAARVRHRIAGAIARQRDHFFARGRELGFHYARGVVAPEQGPKPQVGDGVRDYLPTTWPGCRLPHAWLRARDVVDSLAGRSLAGTSLSTLDLARPDAFVLLVDATHAATWRPAVAAIRTRAGLAIELVAIHAVDTTAPLVDVDGAWSRAREVDASGAVLVRPDGHVAWRAMTAPADPVAELAAIHARLVGGFTAATPVALQGAAR